MIYIFENTKDLNENFIEQAFPLLSRERQKKISYYKILSDKIDGCVGFLLLRYALKNEYNITAIPEFTFGEYGKPFLKNYNIHFNISHCKNAVVCAVSDKNVAVDIMDYRKIHNGVIKRVCSDIEKTILNTSQNKDKDFIKLWVMKECYSKLVGKGLSMDFSKITADLPECKNFKYIETDSYILACSEISDNKIIKLNTKQILKINGESL
ncbi:MAG: 4'-phosphopantetheinyl transferase superfamily protein [Clostridia bacterium]|nr:4'-phosphopantetheinyl transferase superfamily protein [Clostridia bacterium]